MYLQYKFFSGHHHYLILPDKSMSPRDWQNTLNLLEQEGYTVYRDGPSSWVSFDTDMAAVEFKLKYG